MLTKKKIVLFGPASAGKTSIKKTFFEKYSPISLLENPLNPSRGFNTSTYSLFDSELGIFDLAGQENELWLSNSNKSIFNNSNLIIGIFDIRNSVESIIQFLLNIYQIQIELKLKSCHIVAFLHKIDLVTPSYVERKIKTIQDFFTQQHPRGIHFQIYETSITQKHYYNTFRVLIELLKMIVFCKETLTLRSQMTDFREQFSIILNGVDNKRIQIEKLIHKLNFSEKSIKFHINELQKKGIINIEESPNAVMLSDSAYFYKIGLEHKKYKQGGVEREEDYETFLIFLLLNNFDS